jgi:addiction module RelE/StbE family toxin
MNVKYSPLFLSTSKKLNVIIRKSLKERLAIFIRDPQDVQLDNHELKNQWIGYISIDITADYRAIYKVIYYGTETVAYFVAIGNHKQLYSK